MDRQKFSDEVSKKLKNYVYRLIDPRNGETFYVGKGTGNRIFSHIIGAEGDEVSDKLRRIREIHLAGLQVIHVIHRHGMDPDVALEVESALIDATAGLTNINGGAGANDYGPMHPSQIIERYEAEEAHFDCKALMISVPRTAGELSLYEATRYSWRINPDRARLAEITLSVVDGMIRGVFTAVKWCTADATNFPGREPSPGRYGFIGNPAPQEVANLYLGKRVPDRFRVRGAANPIKYSWLNE